LLCKRNRILRKEYLFENRSKKTRNKELFTLLFKTLKNKPKLAYF